MIDARGQLCPMPVIMVQKAAKENPADVDALLAQKFVDDESKTIADLVSEATVAIGEKISIRRFARFETKDGAVESYIHMGGKIGVLVETKNDNPATFSAPAFKAFYHDVALQIAAARPSYVRKDEVPSENLNKEKEILRAQALNDFFLFSYLLIGSLCTVSKFCQSGFCCSQIIFVLLQLLTSTRIAGLRVLQAFSNFLFFLFMRF